MKVQIRDPDALRRLSAIDVKAYLTAQGWEDQGRLGSKATIHSMSDGQGRDWEVLIPSTEDIGDYSERMAEAISIISELEDRPELEVFSDLAAAGSDVIRLRAPDADDQGTIPIQAGVALYEEAQNLLLAAACSVVRPRRTYHARKVTEAVEYLEGVRLGQTERGSYVLTVLSPVGPTLRRLQQPALGPEYENDPFPRLVTRKLAEALTAVRLAVTEAVATDDFAAFENSVPRGVSANLCESIARLTFEGQGLDVALTWARVRPAPEVNLRQRFTLDNARILESAAREFRKDEPRLDESLTGFVIALDRGPEQFDGNATLQVLLDNSLRRIRATFEQREFESVIKAFTEKTPINLDGDVYPIGQRYELRNPRGLSVLEDDSEDNNDQEEASTS